MNYSHTPGPWKVQITAHQTARGITAAEITSEDWDVVAIGLGVRRAADALLIAAAPTLLDAIQYALTVDPNEPAGEIQPLLAKAALTAAEG